MFKEREKYWLVYPATEEEFYEMLGCLPPENYYQKGGFSMFQMAEHQSHDFTRYFVRICASNYEFINYFTFIACLDIPPAKVHEMINHAVEVSKGGL